MKRERWIKLHLNAEQRSATPEAKRGSGGAHHHAPSVCAGTREGEHGIINPSPAVVWCVHGSRELGMGHVIRSLRVILELEARHGVEVYIAGRWSEGADSPLWRRHPLHLHSLAGTDPVPQAELEWLCDRVRAKLLVFDCAFDPEHDAPWLAGLRGRGLRIASLHEHAFPWVPVDLAVNPSVIEQALAPEVPADRVSLQGPDYLLVDPAYAEAPLVARQPATLAVVLGGADPGGWRRRIMPTLLADPVLTGWRLGVVQGPAMAAPDWPADPRVELIEQPGSLVPLFQEAQIAITNGGTTCYEALAAGARVVGVAQNPWEAAVIGWLADRGAVTAWGTEAVRACLAAPASPPVVDGLGVQRLTAHLGPLAL